MVASIGHDEPMTHHRMVSRRYIISVIELCDPELYCSRHFTTATKKGQSMATACTGTLCITP